MRRLVAVVLAVNLALAVIVWQQAGRIGTLEAEARRDRLLTADLVEMIVTSTGERFDEHQQNIDYLCDRMGEIVEPWPGLRC